MEVCGGKCKRDETCTRLTSSLGLLLLPKVAFPSPPQGTTTAGLVGRGLGEGMGLRASKR